VNCKLLWLLDYVTVACEWCCEAYLPTCLNDWANNRSIYMNIDHRRSRLDSSIIILKWCFCAFSDGLELFRQYLRSEYSEENLEFWIACEEYRTMRDERQLIPQAQKIFTDFVAIQAPREVSWFLIWNGTIRFSNPSYNVFNLLLVNNNHAVLFGWLVAGSSLCAIVL